MSLLLAMLTGKIGLKFRRWAKQDDARKGLFHSTSRGLSDHALLVGYGEGDLWLMRLSTSVSLYLGQKLLYMKARKKSS
jgi:hypothetical protein